jgi:hypothetical protein
MPRPSSNARPNLMTPPSVWSRYCLMPTNTMLNASSINV